MTQPDAVVNAPVTRAHREEAARAFCLEATGDSMSVRWCAEWLDARERGVDLRLGRIITGKLDAMAQSLANLEAAVRRERNETVRQLTGELLNAIARLDHHSIRYEWRARTLELVQKALDENLATKTPEELEAMKNTNWKPEAGR